MLSGDADSALRQTPLQAKRLRQELERQRTVLVVEADREFSEGEERAIYMERRDG